MSLYLKLCCHQLPQYLLLDFCVSVCDNARLNKIKIIIMKFIFLYGLQIDAKLVQTSFEWMSIEKRGYFCAFHLYFESFVHFFFFL